MFFRKSKCNFFQILINQASSTLQGIQALQEYLKDPSEMNAKNVRDLEKHSDEVRRILIDELNKTFVTPIDREDIFALSLDIDDIIDYGKSTVDEMEVFEIKPDFYLQKMAEILASGTKEINDAVLRLEKNPNIANEHAVRAKSFENQMEYIYRDALVDLFKGKDIIYMLKMREVYRHLSNAADRCDESANVIGDIVVKMA
ncbi:MAG: DUF47 family protein [Candidatus Firestonebacteria bacterium]